jgi:hypothetical protein
VTEDAWRDDEGRWGVSGCSLKRISLATAIRPCSRLCQERRILVGVVEGVVDQI